LPSANHFPRRNMEKRMRRGKKGKKGKSALK